MINGQIWHWAHEYLPTFMAAGGAIRQALPLTEWLKIGVVALVTAVLTSQVTLARLDERQQALLVLRTQQITNRDAQIQKMEARDQRMEDRLNAIAQDIATLKARIR